MSICGWIGSLRDWVVGYVYIVLKEMLCHDAVKIRHYQLDLSPSRFFVVISLVQPDSGGLKKVSS